MLKFLKDVDIIKEFYSGKAAREYIGDITRFHRIQASPGIRKAAKYCLKKLKSFGLPAKILSFPADGKQRYWSLVVPQEWSTTKAKLELIAPKRMKLCDYKDSKLSVIQRTAPFKGTCEMVILEDGEKDEEYKDLDLKGKVVLTKGDITRVYQLAVVRSGAVGIIYDGMRKIDPIRDRLDLLDAREYRSFWWQKGEEKCFGFVLTPRQGEMLRRLVKKKKKIKLKVDIKSRFYNGKIEVVTGIIPGRTKKEILVVSHLCHPQPSANDNASGCAASLEIARTLKSLIKSRKLSKPRRTIRFLYLPEMTGTYAYLASDENRIGKILAGINLDMVGENQDLCGSSLLFEEPPAAYPSFVHDLVVRLSEEFYEDTKGFGGTGGYPLFRYAKIPFSGGSDHFILSDPTVGIPSPMLIQWPDKFYHTSFDTIDKVDTKMLFKIGCLAASYTYFLAQSGKEEIEWLSQEIISRTKRALLEMTNNWHTSYLHGRDSNFKQLKKKINFYTKRRVKTLNSLRRLSKIKIRKRQITTFANQLIRDLRKKVGKTRSSQLEIDHKSQKKARKMIPKRVYRGPISVRSHHHKLTDADKDKYHKLTSEHLIWDVAVKAVFWTDGKRNLKEIAELVHLESGKLKYKFLVEYFEILEKLKLVKIKRVK